MPMRVVIEQMRKKKDKKMSTSLNTLAGAGLVGIVLAVLSGCAYLNGDAMWLSKDQKSVSISNTLLTLTETEYEFDEDNLPFCFTCKPSKTPYDFIVHLETNSVFKIRIRTTNSDVGSEDDAVIAVGNGVATVYGGRGKLEWQMWHGSGYKKCGTSISQCKGFTLTMCPNRGRCLVYLSSAEHSYYLEIEYGQDKSCRPNCLVIEECRGAKLRHLGNWYDW